MEKKKVVKNEKSGSLESEKNINDLSKSHVSKTTKEGECPSPAENKPLSPAEEKKREDFRKKKLKLAQKYSDTVVKKFKKVVKAVVLFGSFTRKDFHEKSDMDLLVIIDDTISRFTPEMKESFDAKLRDIGKEISKDISVQPSWTLIEFWDMARVGHPLLFTIVRDGWALYDTGFFIPVRKMLEAGKVPHTLEAIELLMHEAPKKIQRVESAKLYMIAEDLYYSMLNSSQAVLMFMGRNSPTPKHASRDVEEYMVKTKMLPRKYLKNLEDVVKFRKGVEHKDIKKVSGEKLDLLIKNAEEYVEEMNKLLTGMQIKKKEAIIMKNYEVMIKGVVSVLKSMGKLPKDPKELPVAVREHLVATKKISPFYEEVLKQVATMRKMVEEKHVSKIPERDVEMTREYVRRFARELSLLMDKKAVSEDEQQ